MLTTIFTLILSVTGLAQEAPKTHESVVTDRYQIGLMVFHVERATRFEIGEQTIRERVEETIITPTGKRIPGAPAGLGCDYWVKLDPERCVVQAFTENAHDVFLITTTRVYTYDLSADDFALVETLDKRVSGELSGTENVFLLTAQKGDPMFVGLLIGHDGAWLTVTLPESVDLSEKFEVRYLDNSVVFSFNKRKRLVCILSTHACNMQGFKEPK